jgi:uncharacterized protein (DUF488 family)
MINIFTIGFTKKTAEQFFTQLKQSQIKTVVDIRLNNSSQLAGFTKQEDLKFFLREICQIDYIHLPALAPTKTILDEYKRQENWQLYEQHFITLMKQRCIETIDKNIIHQSCLLCSENKPQYCHRRLVAVYLSEQWKNV